METLDVIFTVTFIITLSGLSYFLGSAVTGYMAGSLYCVGGDCTTFCRADSDCTGGDVCCSENDFGVCRSECIVPYVHTVDVDLYSLPYLEGPSAPKESYTAAYLIMLCLAFVLGFVYLHLRKQILP